MRDDYFAEPDSRLLFEIVSRFYSKYLSCPTKAVLYTELDSKENVPEKIFENAKTLIRELDTDEAPDIGWLVDETERFCQGRAIYNALLRSISIFDKKDKQYDVHAIPEILTQALGISFNTTIGHDYIQDAEERFEYYHAVEHRVDFDIDLFNQATNGGLAKKTINVLMAGTNVGKTLCMCHMASSWLQSGKSVLYITMEMSEKEIGKRIDANLLDIPLGLIDTLTKDVYLQKVKRVKEKSLLGKLKIHEYPTAGAGAADFRVLLNNLRIKQGFIPDIVIIDYLNICKSARMTNVGDSYGYVKAIIEELRGLAVEFDYCCVTATQTNRSGSKDNDVDMDQTAESYGVPMTADLIWAVMAPEELFEQGLYLFKQLKSRYANKFALRRFVVGVDPDKQRLYNADNSAQKMLYENQKKSSTSGQPQDKVEKTKALLWSDI